MALSCKQPRHYPHATGKNPIGPDTPIRRSSVRYALLSIACFIACFIACLFVGAGPAQAQEDAPLSERIRLLDLDSLDAGLVVYHSSGYGDRAEAIGRQIAASNAFYRDSLGAEVEIRVALLDPADHERASTGLPYGLPFIDDHMAVLPADLGSGAVIEMYAPFETTASPEILASLQAVELSYEEAKRHMVDLIGLHEIGHAQVSAYGIDARQPWFNEFLASYFGYAYMRSREPEMSVVWDAVTQAGREGYVPTHSSLDDLNRLYIGVGVGDYVWYQNVFQERIRAVYDEQGLGFLRRVRERLSDSGWDPEPAAELLEVLEEIAPGFTGWSETFRR